MAYKTREPSLAYVHPLIRLYYLRGYLTSGYLSLSVQAQLDVLNPRWNR